MWAAALLCVAVAVAACSGGSKNRAPTGTPSASTAAAATTAPSTATPSPQPAVDLASQIGVRADLPVADAIDLAARYRTTPGRIAPTKPFAGEANIGDTRSFFVANLGGGALSRRDATGTTASTMQGLPIAWSTGAIFALSSCML